MLRKCCWAMAVPILPGDVSRIGAVAVQHHLDAVAWRKPRTGHHRGHHRELRLAHSDRRSV